MGRKTPTVIGFSDWTLAAPSSRRGILFPQVSPPLDSSSRLGRLFRCYHGAHLIPGLAWKLRYVCLAVRAALVLIFTCTLPFGVGAVERARLLEDFQAVAQVFVHPRCANCHAAGDGPAQTDSGRPHSMNVQRGTRAHGCGCARRILCRLPCAEARQPGSGYAPLPAKAGACPVPKLRWFLPAAQRRSCAGNSKTQTLPGA